MSAKQGTTTTTVFVLTENERGEGGLVRGVYATLADAQERHPGPWVTYGDAWRLDDENRVDYFMLETFEVQSVVGVDEWDRRWQRRVDLAKREPDPQLRSDLLKQLQEIRYLEYVGAVPGYPA